MSITMYGVITKGGHVDVSKTERGAKNYATRNGYGVVSSRSNASYYVQIVAHRKGGRWIHGADLSDQGE